MVTYLLTFISDIIFATDEALSDTLFTCFCEVPDAPKRARTGEFTALQSCSKSPLRVLGSNSILLQATTDFAAVFLYAPLKK